jgi:hypothetical protein
MADLVTVQTLFSGPRHLVMRFTNVSDGTGEAGVIKVNATTANGIVVQGQTIFPQTNLKITKCQYDVSGMGLRIQWKATTNEDILVLGGFNTLDFTDIGGIQNPGTANLAGSTGSIAFTTIAAAANATYTVILSMSLGIPQV